MILKKEKRTLEFRKETFEIVFHYFKCEDSFEQFTTTALDEINMNQVYNQYREKYNIPFAENITKIRKKYGLSASKMSEILGFGINSYRQYEAGEMPSVANAKLIQIIEDPEKFIDMVKLCNTLDSNLKEKIILKTQTLVDEKKRNAFQVNLKNYLIGHPNADLFSGYRNPNFEKLTEMVVFFSDQCQPFKTKMNKLLFYADFLMFKNSCFSISGMRYKALEMGPVPNNFQSIFEYLSNTNEIEIHTVKFPQGISGEQFFAKKERPFNPSIFSENELEILTKVATSFQNASSSDIIEHSHLEEAWIANKNEKSFISYQYAFDLKLSK